MDDVFYVAAIVAFFVIYFRWWAEDRKIRYRAEIPCAGSPEGVLAIVERHLGALGYRVTDGRDHRRMFRYAEGRLLASHRADRAHYVKAIATGATVVFEVMGLHGRLGGDDRDLFAQRFGGVNHALRGAAPPRLPFAPPARATERTHTVERQVVVARCRYCGELSPVDLDFCKNCGAKKFV